METSVTQRTFERAEGQVNKIKGYLDKKHLWFNAAVAPSPLFFFFLVRWYLFNFSFFLTHSWFPITPANGWVFINQGLRKFKITELLWIKQCFSFIHLSGVYVHLKNRPTIFYSPDRWCLVLERNQTPLKVGFHETVHETLQWRSLVRSVSRPPPVLTCPIVVTSRWLLFTSFGALITLWCYSCACVFTGLGPRAPHTRM